MPARFDLTDWHQPGGRLTARKLNLERTADDNGRSHWDCDCDCGGTATVSADNLRRLVVRSCGCLLREHAAAMGREQGAKTAERYAAQHVITGPDGEVMLSPKAAAEYINRGRETIRNWGRNPPGIPSGCPVLGGKRVRRRLVRGTLNGGVRYYVQADLDRAAGAAAELVTIPEYPGLVYYEAACEDLCVCVKTLRRRLSELRPPGRLVRRPALRTDGQPCTRAYIRQEDFDAIKAAGLAHRRPGPPTKTMTGAASNNATKSPGETTAGSDSLPRVPYLIDINDISDEALRKLAAAQQGGSAVPDAANGHATTPKARKRPAEEKHAIWLRWQEEGLSYEEIRRRWERETEEAVTRDAVIKALKRLAQKP